MSPVSRRTGKTYMAGSQKSWGGWEPRWCQICRAPITLKTPGAFHSRLGLAGQPVSVHSGCGGFRALFSLAGRRLVEDE